MKMCRKCGQAKPKNHSGWYCPQCIEKTSIAYREAREKIRKDRELRTRTKWEFIAALKGPIAKTRPLLTARQYRLKVKWMKHAHMAVRVEIRAGRMCAAKDSGLPCIDCGAPAAHWEHRDYGKALEVQPTCRRCNARRGPAIFPNRPPKKGERYVEYND